jgi:hypothetical protein
MTKKSNGKIDDQLSPSAKGGKFPSNRKEALLNRVEKRKLSGPRKHVLAQYQASVDRNSELYERLASELSQPSIALDKKTNSHPHLLPPPCHPGRTMDF